MPQQAQHRYINEICGRFNRPTVLDQMRNLIPGLKGKGLPYHAYTVHCEKWRYENHPLPCALSSKQV